MMKRYLYIMGLLALAVAPAGCGPGFPIVTAEQARLENNVETLLKDNAALKQRVSSLEAAGGGPEAEDLKFSVAEATSQVMDLRREFSFVQGSLEEVDHKTVQTREDLKALSAGVDELSERITGIEGALRDAMAGFKALEGRAAEAAEAAGAAGEGTKEAVSALDARLAALETRIGAVETALTAAKKAPPAGDAEALYHKAYQQTLDKDYAGAEKNLTRFLKDFPDHKLAENARYWLGETHYSKGDWERAILDFDKVIKKHPGGVKAPGALLKQAMSFEKLGSVKEARVLLEQVVKKYPKTKEAKLARARLKALKPPEKQMKKEQKSPKKP